MNSVEKNGNWLRFKCFKALWRQAPTATRWFALLCWLESFELEFVTLNDICILSYIYIARIYIYIYIHMYFFTYTYVCSKHSEWAFLWGSFTYNRLISSSAKATKWTLALHFFQEQMDGGKVGGAGWWWCPWSKVQHWFVTKTSFPCSLSHPTKHWWIDLDINYIKDEKLPVVAGIMKFDHCEKP